MCGKIMFRLYNYITKDLSRVSIVHIDSRGVVSHVDHKVYDRKKYVLLKAYDFRDVNGRLLYPGDIVEIEHRKTKVLCLAETNKAGVPVFVAFSIEFSGCSNKFMVYKKKFVILGSKYTNSDLIEKYGVKVFV